MKNKVGTYNHKKIEKDLQKKWSKEKIYTTKENKKDKYYVLDMFPYPSGEGLHVGHPKGYIATDILSRMKRMQGHNVLHPMGFDAFGLPAENYALKTKTNPMVSVAKNVKRYKKQLEILGLDYDWSREVNTTDPEYYKWTQWIFLQLLKKGLAFQSFEPINWCPSCKTGLANEDIEDSRCERCGTIVEKKPMRQWVLKITDYAEKLLQDLDAKDKEGKPLLDWPEYIIEAQRNWIGRSEGALISFKLENQNSKTEDKKEIKVFTTRPDTLFGVTYVVLAPEHKLIQSLLSDIVNKEEVTDYIEKTKKENVIDRTDEKKEKTGVPLKGIFAINPVNNEKVPVWIADYVLADYGTGAVMAVPAHDERDWDFAKKYELEIKVVVIPENQEIYHTQNFDLKRNVDFIINSLSKSIAQSSTTQYGVLVNSGSFNGKKSSEVMKEITTFANGQWITTYKLRDWVFSRQRYWGEPIPVIHCERCGVIPVPEKDLPVKLPKVKSYEPTGTGESPLAAIEKWVNVKCPKCYEERNKTKYLIFDFDGVLGDTWNVQLQAKVDMGDAKNKESAALSAIKWFSSYSDHTRDTIRTPEQIKARDDWNNRFGELMAKSKFKLFEGFIKELKALKNVKFAVVSSGSAKYVVPALKKSKIKFTHILSYEDHHSKEEKVEKICRDWKINVNEAYYFTDTNQDFFELSKIMEKNKIIACSWGYLDNSILKEVFPEKQIMYKFTDIREILNVSCKAKRETNTMPQWAGSSWYYLRYEDPKNKKSIVDKKREKYWSPVDVYVGGAEHATRHLIYARFWHKFLYDIGVVSTREPFKKLQSVGLIMGEDGRKMSKRFGNVINPDNIADQFGADTLRVYEMFMGPFDQQIGWSTNSIIGCRRFIEKVWRLQNKIVDDKKINIAGETESLIHKTIKKVGEDITAMRFNTAISAMMIMINELESLDVIRKSDFETITKLLAPFAPHITDHMWRNIGNKKSIHISEWPQYNPQKIQSENITIVVQVNGKVRGNFTTNKSTTSTELENTAKNMPEIRKWIDGKEIIKTIVIEGKLVNIVIKEL